MLIFWIIHNIHFPFLRYFTINNTTSISKISITIGMRKIFYRTFKGLSILFPCVFAKNGLKEGIEKVRINWIW